MSSKEQKAFGKNVQRIRKEQGLSQEKLALKAKVHRTYIGMLERGEKNATLESINKVAKALKVSICELTGE